MFVVLLCHLGDKTFLTTSVFVPIIPLNYKPGRMGNLLPMLFSFSVIPKSKIRPVENPELVEVCG